MLSEEEKVYNRINKLKRIWTIKIHPNLWQRESQKWKYVNMTEVRMKCEEFQNFGNTFYDLWNWLESKYNIGTLDSNINYNTTTNVNTWKPYNISEDYKLYKENIKKHLNEKENFKYHWKFKSKYNVTVKGEYIKEYNEYCTWFNLEFKDGNMDKGYYYFLINESLALLYVKK